MTADVSSGRLHLAPAPESAAEARSWVTAQLEGRVAPELVDTAMLLVSEVVTNAVLHAGTDIELGVEHLPGAVRIEVADRSTGEPGIKNYDVAAGTGRGLLLVEALAAGWGVTPAAGGKIVWFELSSLSQPEAVLMGEPDLSDWPDLDEPAPAAADPAPDPADMSRIDLLGLPIELYRRCSEQYDAVGREFRLIAEREPDMSHAPARIIALADELSGRYSTFTAAPNAELRAAMERGDASIDLSLRLPSSVGPFLRRYDELLDEADSYCREGTDLLSLEPTGEAVAFRKWLLFEFVRQVEGQPALRWVDSDWGRRAREG